MSPRVSLIMANYKGAGHLPAAIASAQAQTMADWELLIVDDASPDDSIAVARAAAANDPRVRVMAQGVNQGPAAARNRALDAATGEWVAVFDSDDLMAPDRLERLIAVAQEDGADIVADNLMFFTGQPDKARGYLTGDWAAGRRWIGLADFVGSATLYAGVPDLGYVKPLIRLADIRRASARYDEQLRIGEDFNFLARLLASGLRMRLIPDGLYFYRRHAASISHRSSARDLKAQLEADQRFHADYGWLGRDEMRAFDRRRRSIEALIAYDQVIATLKTRATAKAASLALSQPRIWPLLTRPIKARLSRIFQPAEAT